MESPYERIQRDPEKFYAEQRQRADRLAQQSLERAFNRKHSVNVGNPAPGLLERAERAMDEEYGLEDALAEPHQSDTHGEWEIHIYDDQPVAEGKKYAANMRVVWLRDGVQQREALCPSYKIWTVLAHWKDDLPTPAASDGGSEADGGEGVPRGFDLLRVSESDDERIVTGGLVGPVVDLPDTPAASGGEAEARTCSDGHQFVPESMTCLCGDTRWGFAVEKDGDKYDGRVQGRCPSCGGSSLFLGDGGYVTCSRSNCVEPDAATTMLERTPAAETPHRPTLEAVVRALEANATVQKKYKNTNIELRKREAADIHDRLTRAFDEAAAAVKGEARKR